MHMNISDFSNTCQSPPSLTDFAYAPIAIVGLGYVGLPLAVAFGNQRPTIGFDIDSQRIIELRKGNDRTAQQSQEQLNKAVLLELTCDITRLQHCKIFIIAVPTPVDTQKDPDLGPLRTASYSVGQYIKPGDLIIYESTVYPGTTEEICIPILEEVSHLRLNYDFFCGYSPERINPGDSTHDIRKICKITSGSSLEAARCVDHLYRQIIEVGTWCAPSIRVAEAAKIVENIQRDVNIALVNELAIIFSRLGIDTRDVLEGASTKWNFTPYEPGLVGGHCIGVDPYYLLHKSHSVGLHPSLIHTARRVNNQVIQHIVERVIQGLGKHDIAFRDAHILQLGITFKENCPDIRNSLAAELVTLFQQQGANVTVHDPWADAAEVWTLFQICLCSEIAEKTYDAIVLAVAHDAYCLLTQETLGSYTKDQKKNFIYDIKAQLPRNIVSERL